MMFTHVPPRHPRRRPAALAAAVAALENGDWARLEGVPELEADLERWHGSGADSKPRQVWFVASGTAALEACLLGHGIGPGDEVITTPYTWGATVSAILAIGAIPIFADIEPLTGLMDPATVPPLKTSRTRAVLGVHLFGAPFAADQLRAWCDQEGLVLIEDGSQAHGARLHGQRVGGFGHAAAFSCMGLKLLAGTEGGYALFADVAAAECAALYGRHPRGLPVDRAEVLGAAGLLDSLQLGWRPCTVSAALIRAQLPYLDVEVATRRRNLQLLRDALADCTSLTVPPEPIGGESACHLLSLLYHGEDLVAFRARLTAAQVATFRYIPTPIHRLRRLNPHEYQGPPVFWHEHLRRAGIDYRRAACPHTDWRAAHEVTMAWNWTDDAPVAMADLATVLKACC